MLWESLRKGDPCPKSRRQNVTKPAQQDGTVFSHVVLRLGSAVPDPEGLEARRQGLQPGVGAAGPACALEQPHRPSPESPVPQEACAPKP